MPSPLDSTRPVLPRRDRAWCRLAVAVCLGVWTGVCGSEAPIHDSPEQALPLEGPAGVLSVELRGATLDPAEPAGGWELRRTVWYEWTAPGPGTLLVSVAGSPNLTPFAAVFRQGGSGGLGPGQPVDFRLEAAMPVSEGERIHLAVGDRWGPEEPVILRHRWVPLPANDDWSAAATVPADESEVVGTLWGATLDSREQELTGGTTPRVWHVWKAVAGGWATVELRSLRPGDSPFVPGVFRGRPESLSRNSPPVETLEAIPVEAGDWLSLLPGGAPNTYALRVLWSSARLEVMPPGPLEAGQPAAARVTVSEAEGEVREVEFLVNGTVQFTDPVAPYEWELTGWDSGVHALAARVIRRGGDVRAVPPQPLEIRPPNDRLASAAVLDGESAGAPVRLEGATAEPGEPGHLGFPPRRTVWWRWTAPRDGGVRLTLERPDQSWPGALLAIYRGGGAEPLRVVGGTEYGNLVVPVRSGEMLSLVVGCGPQCDDAPRTLRLEMFPAAANDDFAEAAALTGEFQSLRAYAGLATQEPEEWAVPPESHRSLWWHWTPSGPGLLDLTAGSATYLDAYAGDSLASLTPLASLPSTQGRLPVAGGQRVFLRARPAGAADEVAFSLQFTPLPPGDAFAEALPLGPLPVEVRGVLGLATGEAGEPNPGTSRSPRSLWYRWTAAADGPVFLGIGPELERGHPEVLVFSGSRVDQLTLLAAAGSGFQATAGVTYSIGVFSRSFWETTEPFEFRLLPPPENDRPAQAPLLVETGDRVRGHTALASLPGTVWYRWRPSVTGTATLVHRGSALAEVRVFAGETVGGDGPVALDRMPLTPREAVFQFSTEAGQLLWIAVGSTDPFPSEGGVFELTVAPSDIGVTGVDPERVEGVPLELTVESQWASGLAVRVWSATSAVHLHALDPAGGRFRLEGLEPGNYRVAGLGTNASGLLLASPFLPLHVAPTNDAFAHASPLSPLPFLLNGSTVGATLEPGEPQLDTQADGGSRWWTWRAPADGAVRLVEGVGVGLFEGGSLLGLTPVLLEPGGSGSQVAQVHGGALYHLMGVPSEFPGPGGSGSVYPFFRARIAWIPSNDRFEDRIRITGGHLDLIAEAAGAETEWGNPVEADPTLNSVWYSWTAPGDGWLTLEEASGSFFHSARVYLAGGGDRLRLMASTRSGDPSLSLPVSGGVSHELVLGDSSSSWEAVRAVWRLRWHPVATNDAFASRTLLAGDTVLVEGYSVGTTREAGEEERRHAWTGELIERTQWFSWVASVSGWARLEQDPSLPPVLVEVFEGDTLASLQTLWPAGLSFQPMPVLDFPVEAGRTYALWVGAGRDHRGAFQVRLSGAEPPENDSFAAAEGLAGTEVRVRGTTRNATLEPGEPESDSLPATESVWYRWTSPGRGVVRCWGSPWRVTLWTGDSLRTLQVVGEGDLFHHRVEAGVEYFVRVSGTDLGSFDLSLIWEPSPPNDDFLEALRLTLDTPTTVEGSASGATAEPGEFGPSLWWRWTAPASGRVSLDRKGQVLVFGRAVSAAEFSPVPALSWVGDQSDHTVQAGGEYFLRLTRWDAAPFQFRVAFAPDNFPATMGVPQHSGDRLRLPLQGMPGAVLRVEGSEDLVQWTAVLRHWLLFPGEEAWVPVADGGVRFFRTVSE